MSTENLILRKENVDRLVEAIEASGIKKYGRNKKVAQITGYSEPRVSEMLSGKIPLTKKFLSIICSKFSISEEYVTKGTGSMFFAESPSAFSQIIGRSTRAIPVQEIPVLGRISAGFPNFSAEEVIEYIAIPGTPENTFALIVKGASMEPNIKDGDYVLFVENGEYRNNDVLIVLDEWGDAMVKRLKEKEGIKYLVSDNSAYPVLIPNENYRIIGKVVKAWRDLKF